MIKEIPINEPHIYAFQVSGKLDQDDYEKFQPKLELILKREKPLSLLIQLEDFDGWTAKAAWQDFKLGKKHQDDFLRIAIVGDSVWEKVMTDFGDLFTKAKAEYFEDEADALNWLKEVDNLAQENEYIGYRHIMVATDFSRYSDTALKKALELAKPFDAKISVVHVAEVLSSDLYPAIGELAVPVMVSNPELEEKQLKRLQNQLDKHLLKLGYSPENLNTVIINGYKVDEIVEYATKNNVDLIVMGSHGRRGLARLVGSATNGVIHHAPCDVLTVV